MGNIRIEEVCDFFENVVRALNEPEKIAILNILANDGNCTFEEIQAKTGKEDLYRHLRELLRVELIYKIDSQSMKYGCAKLLDDLISIVKTINM